MAITQHAQAHPQHPAATDGVDTVSYGELERRSAALAGLLRDQGMRRGDRLVLVVENVARIFEILWAAQRSGLYYTPLNHRSTTSEIAYVLSDLRPKALVVSEATRAATERVGGPLDDIGILLTLGDGAGRFASYDHQLVGRRPIDPQRQAEGLDLLYTSGTTGRARAVLRPLPTEPFGHQDDRLLGWAEAFGIGDSTVYLCPAPLSHAAPLVWSMRVQRVGGTVVLLRKFDPVEALQTMVRWRVTHAQFVPAMLLAMLRLPREEREKHDLSSLQMVIHAGAPMPGQAKHELQEWLGPKVYEYYGATERPGMTLLTPDDWSEKRGSVGRPLFGAVRILDGEGRPLPPHEIGRVYFDGDSNFEYLNDPGKTAANRTEDGLVTMGDLGYLDDEGYVFLVGRADDTILCGGVNVYPQEIEDRLTVHPAVAGAVVVGVPDEILGSVPVAVVEGVRGAVPDSDALSAYCREHLAPYKVPRSFHFVDDLPRTSSGKANRAAVKRRWGGES